MPPLLEQDYYILHERAGRTCMNTVRASAPAQVVHPVPDKLLGKNLLLLILCLLMGSFMSLRITAGQAHAVLFFLLNAITS